jgi:hypothetical protein
MSTAAEVIAQALASVSDSTAIERAQDRDAYVRDFDRRWGDWVPIAECCVNVERDRDWAMLGFSSFNEWLCDAAPRSRSYLYMVIGRYKELSPDMPPGELAQIPLGSAGVLRQLPASLRSDPEVREAAKRPPKEFRESLRESHPEQHIEEIVIVRLKFPMSAWTVISAAYEAYKLVDETASMSDFVEWLVSERE